MRIKGRRILIIGDSLSYPGQIVTNLTEPTTKNAAAPGAVLASLLLELGASAVRINAKVGRSAYNFFKSEQGDTLLAQDAAGNPDVVLVFLGTNDKSLNTTEDKKAFERIASAFPKADVWGIGPPQASGYDPVFATMQAVFGRKLIDSRPYLEGATKASDGVHFQQAGAQLLAERLAVVLAATPSPWLSYTLLGALGATGIGLAYVTLTRLKARKQLKSR